MYTNGGAICSINYIQPFVHVESRYEYILLFCEMHLLRVYVIMNVVILC